MEPKYKRVLLKISGEALAGADRTGLNDDMLQTVAEQVKEVHDLGVQAARRRRQLLERQDQRKHGQSNSGLHGMHDCIKRYGTSGRI